MRKPIYKGVLPREIDLVGEYANMTPNLGFTLYGDNQYIKKPVLEICRLDVGQGRSVINSFDEDFKLATWDREEQDNYFQEAFRSGNRQRFFSDRQAHKANVVAASHLLSSQITYAMAQGANNTVSSSPSGNKDLNSGTLNDIVELSYGRAANIAKMIATGNPSASGIQGAMECAAKAFEALRKENLGAGEDRFAVITNWIYGISKEAIGTAQDYGGYTANWLKQADELHKVWDYYRNGMSEPELLMVEPYADVISNLSGGRRGRYDFEGSFPITAHWYENPSHCKEIFANDPAKALKQGFEVGPATYRQYAAILHASQSAESKQLPPRTLSEKRQMSFMGGTPYDLPPELAEKRLEALNKTGKTEMFTQSIRELREIVLAEQLGRPVDPKMFEASSLQLRPSMHSMTSRPYDQLEKQLKKLAAKEPANASQALMRDQRMAELTYYTKNHVDAPVTQGHEKTIVTPDWAKPGNLENAMTRFEDDLAASQPKGTPEVDTQTNTCIELDYRTDSDGASDVVVLAGKITQAEVDKIEENLIDGFQVIAHQIGLPTPSEQLSEQREFPQGDDHVLTSLASWISETPTADSLHTNEPATHDLTPAELAEKIEHTNKAGWNYLAEDDRMGGIPEEDDLGPSM